MLVSYVAAASPQPAAAPPPPIAPPPASYAPSTVVYAAPPPQKSSGALKIILIVIAVVVGLGVLGAGTVARYELPSSAVDLIFEDNKIYATTNAHSLEVLQLVRNVDGTGNSRADRGG